jgi:hypothetical protein
MIDMGGGCWGPFFHNSSVLRRSIEALLVESTYQGESLGANIWDAGGGNMVNNSWRQLNGVTLG